MTRTTALLAALLGSSCAAAQTPDGVIAIQPEVLPPSCAEAQAPAGLVGRWRAAGPGSALGNARVTEVSFDSGGTGEMRLAALTASPFALVASLTRTGDALAGTLQTTLNGREVEIGIALDEPHLALTIRDEAEVVLDFDRTSGQPGGLAGTWTLRETAARDALVTTFTFADDSLLVEVGNTFYYRVSAETICIGSEPDAALMDAPQPFLLDGDRLALKLTDGPDFVPFVRAEAVAPR